MRAATVWLRMRLHAVPPYGAGRWRDFPALLASGGVWLNSAAPQTTPALIRPPLRCSAAPKGGTVRSPHREAEKCGCVSATSNLLCVAELAVDIADKIRLLSIDHRPVVIRRWLHEAFLQAFKFASL